jgi:hypothetical protein
MMTVTIALLIMAIVIVDGIMAMDIKVAANVEAMVAVEV